MKKGLWAIGTVASVVILFGGASYARADFEICETPDCIGPVLQGASDILLYTNDVDAQLEATYNVTATDNIDESVVVTCNPASPSLFPVGDTLVECSATDSDGNPGSLQFYVTVQLDEIAPEITPPGVQTFSTTTIPAYPTLVPATATDDIDTDVSITYSPLSFSVGTTTVTWTATDDAGNTAATTSEVIIVDTSEPEVETIQIALRDGTTLIGPITLELPASTTPDVALSPTGTTTTYTVPARSVLAMLTTLDATSTAFEITDLAYYTSFSSFIVNCISVADTNDCYNWTYAVNGAFPSVGMDVTELSGGNIVYVFFGSAWQVSVDKTTVEENETFTATIEKYNAETGAYAPAEGEVAGAVQFDDFFVPTEFATSTTDAAGQATLSVANAGEYAVGAQVVSYYPNVAVTVTEPAAEETPTSGGGGGGGVSHLSFNVPAALAYLSSKQSADGSFGSLLLSDWAAIAFAASDPGEAKTKLRAYLISTPPSLTGVQDHIRHSMALMALGIDPYTGTNVDHIAPIVSSYDGTQIGDPSLDNDDIFALFPLTHAGYGASDAMIQRVVAFIVSRQQSNGSWTGGADMTAAAVQALAPLTSLPGVSAALTKAEAYLHTQQQNNGGFGSSSGTSWAMQAIAALGQPETAWTAGGLYPRDYLTTLQQSDGGVELTSSSDLTRIWATEYAIPGATGKTWNALLSSFSKPAAGTTPAGGGTATSTATTTPTTATTTTAVATSTATSTAAVATSSPIAEIIAAIEDETPEEAFTTRIAQVTAPEPSSAETPIPEPQTNEEALEQVAAAATVGDIDWVLIVLAFLALLLFGITGYIAFVRKYWR